MNVFKRSILYITRKKIKSIIMLFILFGIATAVLSGISIKKAANIARQDSNKDMANTFELQANFAGNFEGTIPENLIDKVSKVEGVKNYDAAIQGAGLDLENVNYELQANFAGNFEGTIPENLIDKVSKVEGVKNYDAAIQGAGLDLENVNYIKPEKNAVQYNDDYKYEKLFSVEAHKSSEYDTKFISKSLKLVDGRHIVPTDKGKVLIHKALAEANNLKVGDTIKAKKSAGDFNASTLSKNDYDLEIVGIFESSNTERVGHKLEMPENLLITDVDTVKTLYGYSDGNVKYTNATFNTDTDVDKVTSKFPENLLITDVDTVKTLYGYSDGNVKYTNATFNTDTDVDKVTSKFKDIPADWNKYTIVKSEDTFLALSKSFDSLDKIINMVLIGAIIAGLIGISIQ